MNSKTFGLVAAGLIIGGLFAYLTVQMPGGGGSGGTQIVSGKALVGGPFTLTDQTGKRVTEKDFLGRYMLVFFGFTNCPDICPSGLQVMTAALEKLGTRADEITPVFITVDAERDTPQKLAEYAKSFHPRLVALTGTADEIAAAGKAYRVYYQKVSDEKDPTQYSYDHSSIFYLMGKDGSLLAPIPHTTDVAQLTEAIERALQ